MTTVANLPMPPSYGDLLVALKDRIRNAQSAALQAVNKELIALYWDIGQRIDERQQTEGWGKGVVEALSKDLRAEFGEKSGYSERNLWYMLTFYRAYKSFPILQPLAAEIAWTKNTLILDRCAEPLQREFYLRATARFGWTRRVLDHQIDNQSYEKYLLNQTSFDQALSPAVAAQAKLAVKDHYTFDFLSLSDAHEERELVALNAQLKLEGENDAIGIIVCKSKKRTVVEYALKSSTLPIGVATYGLTSHLPDAYRNLLPSEDQIVARLAAWTQE